MEENSGRIVLCGANAYEQKYYFNEQFSGIPESIQEELRILCVLFTQEVGGVFAIAFEEDGSVVLETNADDDDITYDEVSSGLLVGVIAGAAVWAILQSGLTFAKVPVAYRNIVIGILVVACVLFDVIRRNGSKRPKSKG